jgi:hypothetical protein
LPIFALALNSRALRNAKIITTVISNIPVRVKMKTATTARPRGEGEGQGRAHDSDPARRAGHPRPTPEGARRREARA